MSCVSKCKINYCGQILIDVIHNVVLPQLCRPLPLICAYELYSTISTKTNIKFLRRFITSHSHPNTRRNEANLFVNSVSSSPLLIISSEKSSTLILDKPGGKSNDIFFILFSAQSSTLLFFDDQLE